MEGSVDVPDSGPINNRGREHREKDFCCLRSSTPGKGNPFLILLFIILYGPEIRFAHVLSNNIFSTLYTETLSYRNKEKGSNFIQDVVKIFHQHAHQDHIEELFRKAKSH